VKPPKSRKFIDGSAGFRLPDDVRRDGNQIAVLALKLHTRALFHTREHKARRTGFLQIEGLARLCRVRKRDSPLLIDGYNHEVIKLGRSGSVKCAASASFTRATELLSFTGVELHKNFSNCTTTESSDQALPNGEM
jgi:hypothetical protein